MEHKFHQLQKLGAGDFQHLHGSLQSHLTKTYELLQQWGAAPHVCDAGLFHAAYGTAGFDEKMVNLQQRKDIANVIGADAEALVYFYCSCDRDFFYPKLGQQPLVFLDRFTGTKIFPTDQQIQDFCELTAANEMELLNSSQEFKAQHGTALSQLFQQLLPFTSRKAQYHLKQHITDTHQPDILETNS